MSWLKNVSPKIKKIVGSLKKNIPEGLWHKCPSCQTTLYRSELEKNSEVCPNCGYHNRISSRDRIKLLLDKPNQNELGRKISSADPLKFEDTQKYKERLISMKSSSGENDALIITEGFIESLPVVLAVLSLSSWAGQWDQ